MDLALNNLEPLICHKTQPTNFLKYSPVGWGCRIHQLHICSGVRPPNECPGYDIKQSDGALGNVVYPFTAIVPRSTLVTPDRVLSMGQIELFDI